MDNSLLISRRIWDISPPLDFKSPVFPGDCNYEFSWTQQINLNSPVNVGKIVMSTHTGAHADAPLHYEIGGMPIGDINLYDYIGPCRVIHCFIDAPIIRWQVVANELSLIELPERILIRTYQDGMPLDHFDKKFKAIDPFVIEKLGQMGVRLIGTDSASIDPSNCKHLDSHAALYRQNMRVLENLYLDEIEPHDYELIALPLKLMHADASPVRAILRDLK